MEQANSAACADSALLPLLLQVCWEKFNEYFEVEGRYVPVEVDYPVMSADRIEQYADENTIGECSRVIRSIQNNSCSFSSFFTSASSSVDPSVETVWCCIVEVSQVQYKSYSNQMSE